MAVEIIMPKLGMAMKEGTISLWRKQVGEAVKKGEPILEVSSEKIEIEVEAPGDGVLLEMTVQEGIAVPVATVLGFIGQPGEKVEKMSAAQEETAATALDIPAVEKPVASFAAEKKQMKASPVAKKIAEEHGLDLASVNGTGPQGRITKEDVEKALEQLHPPTPQETARSVHPTAVHPTAPLVEDVHRTAVTGIRKVIAARMKDSLQQSAQLTMNMKADVTELLSLQSQAIAHVQQQYDMKLTLTDFVARAVTMALQEHKLMNSAWIQDEIHLFPEVHLGMAVALEKGLVVPVVRNANRLSLIELAKSIKEVSARARSGQLDPSEMSGSTFTITNLGAYGVEHFTPVINPPEAGILGVGAAADQPVWENEGWERRRMLPLSLTFDHRILDGAPAALFLQTIKKYLEHPYFLLL